MDYHHMDKYELRRLALISLIDSLGRGAQRKLAGKIGVEPSYVSRMCYEEGKAGRKRIGEDTVEKLEKEYPGWLGEIEVQLPAGSYKVDLTKLAHIPVIGKGMGGLPDRVFTDEGRPMNGHDEFAEVYSTDPSAFVVRVDGNSMYPKYVQGEYALVEPNNAPELEDDVILKTTKGEVLIKRLISRRGGIHLASYNDPQTYFYPEEEIIWMYYVAYPVPSRKIKSRI